MSLEPMPWRYCVDPELGARAAWKPLLTDLARKHYVQGVPTDGGRDRTPGGSVRWSDGVEFLAMYFGQLIRETRKKLEPNPNSIRGEVRFWNGKKFATPP